MLQSEMVSYTETRNQEPFDWNTYLDNYSQHTEAEQDAAAELAADWVTCACGTQCSLLPRAENGAPDDNLLRSNGRRFYEAFRDGDLDLARVMLASIERRSTELLKKLKSR
jgi:hypothetical protein